MAVSSKQPPQAVASGSVEQIVANHGQEKHLTAPPWQAGKRRPFIAQTLLLLLIVLLVLIAPQANYEHSVSLVKLRDPNIVQHFGQFVQPPLSAIQVDALSNLVAHMSYKQLARYYVAHMTLDEELGQLFMAEYYDTYYSPDLDTMVNKLHAGGVVMYAFQMNTFNQTKHDIADMQKNATLPLLISTDEEGGFVERVQNIFGHHPGALEIYQTGNVNNAVAAGHRIAHDLLSLGINEDLAPDVDVQLVDGPDQYLRTWGYTPQSVITYAGAYMQAVQSDGVVACYQALPRSGSRQYRCSLRSAGGETHARSDLRDRTGTVQILYSNAESTAKPRYDYANRCVDARH